MAKKIELLQTLSPRDLETRTYKLVIHLSVVLPKKTRAGHDEKVSEVADGVAKITKMLTSSRADLAKNIRRLEVNGKRFKLLQRNRGEITVYWTGFLTAEKKPVSSFPHLIHRMKLLKKACWMVEGSGIFSRSFGKATTAAACV